VTAVPVDRSLPTNEQDFRFLVENAEDLIAVIEYDGTIAYVNRRGVARFGGTAENVIGRPLASLIAPEELPRVLAIRAARHAGLPSPARYETCIILRGTDRVDVEVSVTGTEWNGRPADVVVLRDISERRRAERRINEREEILRSVAASAESLVRSISWKEGIQEAMATVGRAVGVDGVYVWEAGRAPDGEPIVSRTYIWQGDGNRVEIVGSEYEGLRLRTAGFSRHIDLLLRGEIISGPMREYPEPIRSRWAAGGIRATVAAPILIDGDWWGVMGFLDRTRERTWSTIETDALRVLTSIIGALIRRERIRDDLTRSEERLRLTVEQAPAGIFIADERGRYTEVNTSACQMVGYTREELLGLGIFDLTPPEFRERSAEHFARVLQGEPHTIEAVILCKSGKHLPVEIKAKRLSDGRLQAIVADITERRRVQDELRRRDAILEVVSAAAERFLNSTVWEEQIGHVLEQLARATGADRAFLYENQTDASGEVRTVRRYGWLHPDSKGTIAEGAMTGFSLTQLGISDLTAAMRSGRVLQLQRDDAPPALARVLEKIGIYALTLAPILVEGELWGYFGLGESAAPRTWLPVELDALRVAGDIMGALVRRRRVDAALSASEEKYRTLVEGTKQSIVMIDRDGVFRFGNSTAAERLGYTQETLIGKTMWEIFPHEIADQQMEILRDAIDRRQPVVVERPTIVRGAERWHETRVHPLVDDAHGCESALVLISDIGDRKRAESEILSYQKRLRSLSSELMLTEERERHRIAAVLHDRIGQSLAIAKMRLGAARQATKPDRINPILDEVRQLLDVTIQDTRSLTFEISPPILYELGFEPAVEWLAERFHEQHGIPATFEDDRQPKPLGADLRVFLFQAVQELLLNVAKHARARSVRVCVRREGEQIVVGVADDGVGCDPTRVPSVGSTNGGFGLFNIRERLGLLGGRLEMDSDTDLGTRAWLRAPLRTGAFQDGGGGDGDEDPAGR
jgi:PAS domain S-box-containing protein